MDTRTKERCITTLTRLRDAHQGQLDAGVIEEINAVIAALEEDWEDQEKESRASVGVHALAVMAEVLRLVTNLTDLMK